MSEIISDAIHYIENAPYALFVTVGEGNKPYSRYIGPIVNVGLDVYFMTLLSSQKLKQIEYSPFVVLYFQNAKQTMDKFCSVTLDGNAMCITDENEINFVLDQLGQISPGYKKYIATQGLKNWVVCKVISHRVQYLDLSKSIRPMIEEIPT